MGWSAVFASIGLLPAIIAALLISHLRPGWPRRKAIVIAALPGPAMLMVLCIFVAVNSLTMSDEKCGPDSCNWMLMLAGIMMIFAFVMFLLGLVLAWRIRKAVLLRRRKAEKRELKDVFR